MNKLSWFQRATILTVVGVLVFAIFLTSPNRWWCVSALVAIYLIVSGVGVYSAGMNYFCEAVCRGKAGRKRIALTFDDGPDGAATAVLLDILKMYKAHASFFCVGRQAEANSDLIKRIVNEGHALGNHSYAHHWWTNFLTKTPLVNEINRTQSVLSGLSGITPRYYRSPMGLSNPHLASALRETDMKLIAWDVRPFDRGESSKTIIDRVTGVNKKTSPVSDGSIVLLHDGGASPSTLVESVKGIIEHFQALGFSFVSLDELFQD
jgi:peptidoglycan/xylan/chitin deacetylase (PgdA/CDA1 family)